jgi:hypothetical protein
MKWSLLLPVWLGLHDLAVAFPANWDEFVVRTAGASLADELSRALRSKAERGILFNPKTAPIEVTGAHKFIAPDFAKGDQRGPCPGLNALANHGYISRSGVATTAEIVSGINQVFGMGLDLGGILSIMGTVFVGNPLSLTPGFSIGEGGGRTENLLGNLGGVLGTPRGLTGSHNIIEGDSSNTRNDYYVTGDASTLNLDLFRSLFEMSTGGGDYNMDLFAKRASIRFKESVEGNPSFYFGPFTGLVARNAGYMFAGRMFANYSEANPNGILSKSDCAVGMH